MSRDGIVVIEAAEYEETRVRMMSDPIIVSMAGEMRNEPLENHFSESGTPKHEFMLASNKEYRERGGEDGGFLGAVPDAIYKLLSSGAIKPTKVVSYYASRDNVDAWRDEDRAMCHASIVGNEPSFSKAQDELAAYMVKEAGYLLRSSYGSEQSAERAKEILARVADVFSAKFDGEKNREYINFDIGSLRFQLMRFEQEVKEA